MGQKDTYLGYYCVIHVIQGIRKYIFDLTFFMKKAGVTTFGLQIRDSFYWADIKTYVTL